MSNHKEESQLIKKIKSTPQFERLIERPVAYFCAEYAFEEERRRYAGGLGVLAGDMVREAADMKLPLVAIGLYYREGYICPSKEVNGQVVEECVATPPSRAGFEAVLDKEGKRLHISVPIQDHTVKARVWQMKMGSTVTVYVLDTNCEENNPIDRGITDRLYDNDKGTRFKQEMVLGIGGMRMLEALDIHPSVYHLNEGHSAMLVFELIHHEMNERGLGFDEAKQFARRRIVMTNHTLVAAGHEIYNYDLAAMMLRRYAEELMVPVHSLVSLGLVQQTSEFSLSMLAFRMSTIINAVSKLHAAKAKEIWTDHPMVAVTNGVHVPTWDMVGDAAAAKGRLWPKHQELKKELLAQIKEKAGRDWDPDVMLVGWARRVVRYKRPMAVLEDLGRFGGMSRNPGRPFKLVISGYSHPGDGDGAWLLNEIRRLTDGEFADVAVYLPGYDMKLAKLLVAGCDIWMNTPVVGFEACGTSGMKAALNGALPFSTKDGWVDEVDLSGRGWFINSDRVTQDLFDRLEQDVLPLYYTRNDDGYPDAWEEHMLSARKMIMENYTATRMVRQYVEMLYI
jgi:glucan phosphorylase